MGLGKVAEMSRGNGHNDDVTIQLGRRAEFSLVKA